MSCPEFIAHSFAVRDTAHLLHLSTKSYAKHVALDEFYTGLLDHIDTYAEVYMGLTAQITKFPRITPPSTNDPLELLTDYLEAVKEEQAEDHGSEALKNILAEIEELTARTLYKVKNLT